VVASTAKCESTGVFEEQTVGSDAYVSRHMRQMAEGGRSFSGNERDKLFLNRGDGTFADCSDLSGCDDSNDGRGVIAADFDDDGDVDMFIHHTQRERHTLQRNELGDGTGFLKVRLRATTAQYEAIGAIVTVHGPHGPVADLMTRGAGFVSCQAPELVFGLGEAESARVEVRWVGGESEDFGLIAAGSRVLLVEGSGEAEAFEARPRPLPDPLPLGLNIEIGKEIGDLLMKNDAGELETVSVSSLAGEGELWLNFWASYCSPCVAELPLLDEIDGTKGRRVLLVSADAPGDVGRAQEIAAGRSPSLKRYFIATDCEETENAKMLSALVDLERLPIPTTLVFNSDGELTRVIRGPVEEE
jgi:thiol-disulfide isomerase/thioredoxin